MTDRWFHYDQVGSVMCESDSGGALVDTHFHEAFGNTLAAWTTGLIGGDRAGRHHNTKEFDSDIGLVYMYQRWYSPELGIFVSSAPYPPMVEHRYSFALQAPILLMDPLGMRSLFKRITSAVGGGISWTIGTAWSLPNTAVGAAHGIAGVGVSVLTVPFGGKLSYPHIGEHGIQFVNNPLMAPGSAFCFGGDVSSYASDVNPQDMITWSYTAGPPFELQDHEGGHRMQGRRLGVFFGPVYLFAGQSMEASADHFARTGDLQWHLY